MLRSRHGCHIDTYRWYRKGAFFFLLPVSDPSSNGILVDQETVAIEAGGALTIGERPPVGFQVEIDRECSDSRRTRWSVGATPTRRQCSDHFARPYRFRNRHFPLPRPLRPWCRFGRSNRLSVLFGALSTDWASEPCVHRPTLGWPYSGSQFDIVWGSSSAFAAFAYIDLPLSFVADTLVLPYTISKQVTSEPLSESCPGVTPSWSG
jgi:hypothetical protein